MYKERMDVVGCKEVGWAWRGELYIYVLGPLGAMLGILESLLYRNGIGQYTTAWMMRRQENGVFRQRCDERAIQQVWMGFGQC